MEETNSKLIQGWGLGLPVLVVDHDTTYLMFLASMLEQYSYKVTTTEVVSVAMSMILERKESFKLVMANIDMDDTNSLSFLRTLIKKDIRFILMSSETSKNIAQKAIAYGACLHIQKPISLNELKYLWQHVYRNKGFMTKTPISGNEFGAIKIFKETANEPKPAVAENDDQFHYTNMTTNDPKGKKKASYDDEEDKRNDKRMKSKLHEPTETTEEEGGKKTKNNQKERKPRLAWKKELHQKFIAAFNAFEYKDARPKSILRMMNEPNLTLRQVASHLQKYKAQVHRMSTGSTSNSSSVLNNTSTNIYDKPGFFSMLLKNKSMFSTHPGNTSSRFSIGDTYRYQNHPRPDSTAPICSTYQNQQTPQLPNVLPYVHQKLSCIPNQSTSTTGISLSQSQVFMPSVQTTQGRDFVAAEYTGKPDGDKSLTTPHNEQHSAELADLVKFLDEEADESRESCIEPHPGEVDQFCEWLKEAIRGNNDQP